MLVPLVMSFFASIKTAAEACAVPPTLPAARAEPRELPQRRPLSRPACRPTSSTASRSRRLTIVLLPGAGRPGRLRARPLHDPGQGGLLFLLLLVGHDDPLPGAADAALLHVRQARPAPTRHVGLAIVHTALQLPFSVYLMRNSFEAVPRELEEAAVIDGCNSWQVLCRDLPAGGQCRASSRSPCSPSSPRGTSSSRALVFMNKETQLHRAAHAGRRPHRAASAPSTGARCRRASSSRSCPACWSTCSCRNTTSPASSAARSNERTMAETRPSPPAEPAPPDCREARAPRLTIRDVARLAGGQRRHRLEGAQQRRQPPRRRPATR